MDRKEFLTLIKKLASFGSDEVVEKVETPAVELNEEAEVPSVEPEVEVVAEVEVEAVAEEVAVEVEAEAPVVEYATKDELNDLRASLEEYKSLFSKQVAEKEAMVVELQKQLDEKPDAPAIVATPKVELSQEPASTKKGRIYQFLNNK